MESKTGEKDVSPALHYFRERTGIADGYQVHAGTRDYEKKGIRVLPFQTFCRELRLP